MKRSAGLIIFMAFVCAAAVAADVTVKATVTGNRVALGTGLQYTITVSGAQDLQPPALPAMDAFDVRYRGPGTRVSVINGSYAVEQSFNYILIPLKEGKFSIPSVVVDVKGQMLATEPVPVEVLSAGTQAPGAASVNDLQQDVENRLKLTMVMDKQDVYLGEAATLKVQLFVNQLSLQDLSYPEIAQDGFQMEPFTEPKQFQTTIQGVDWHVVEFSTRLYPDRTGEIVVPPAIVRGALLFRAGEQRESSGGIFDEGFFSSFFSSYQKRPVTVTSTPQKFRVSSLPEEGRPADFSGAVGQFDLNVEASPLKVKAGDPVTLRMTLAGTGNMKALKFPVFEAEGFKVYDPQVKDEPGRKTLEQVIVPTDVKVTQVPAMRFNFFDSSSGVYRTVERGPFPLEVAPPAKGEEFQAVGFARPMGTFAPEKLGMDIVFIKENPGHLEKTSSAAGRLAVFYVVVAMYAQIWAGLLAFYLYRRRLLHDPKFARRLSAARQADKAFREAQRCQASGDIKQFYDMLEKGLRDYFFERLEIPVGNMDISLVEDALRRLKVEEKHARAVGQIHAAAERVRFAGMPVSAVEMNNHLADAEDVVKAVERRAR